MFLARSIAMLLLCAPTLSAYDVKMPAELKADVRFWELVFGSYKSDECVFHDSRHLDVIYGIKKVGGRGQSQERRIAHTRRSITSTLKKLQRGEVPRDAFGNAILRSLPPERRTLHFYNTAPAYIRCQLGVHDSFKKSLVRSEQFIPRIKKQLKYKGLPEDLAYLPHLESGFNYKAHSKVGARGLWQLMPSVAKENGLKVRLLRDDRLDADKATKVALRVLERNYDTVGSWPLAMTGYNYGINGIVRGLKRVGTKDYVEFRKRHKSPSFGFAARNFFPSFLAVRNLAMRHEEKRRSSDTDELASN